MQAIKTILLLSFLFCFSALNAQQKQIDSLYNIFSKTKDLNIKSDAGFNIWKIHASEKDSLNEAKIIDKVQNTFILYNRYDLLAEWYGTIGKNTGGNHGENEYSISNILKGINYLNKGIAFSEKLQDSKIKWKLQGNIYRMIGFKYRDVENHSKSLDNQFLALKCCEKANDLDMVLETYSTLAAIYGRANDNINSLKYARKSITYSFNNGFIPWEYAKKLNVVGNSFLRAEMLDSALFYFMRSLKIYAEDKQIPGITINLNQIGIVYTKLHQLDSANVYLLKSLELGKKKKDQLSIGFTYRDLGNLEFKKGNYEKAIEYLKTSLAIFKSKKKLGGYSSILKSISESYESIGNTNDALRYYKQAKSLDDSLINVSTIREVAIKEATFNYTKDQELSALKLKDKAVAIELLNNKNELQELILIKNELESIEKNKSIQLLSQQDSLKSFTIRQSKAKEAIALAESRSQKNIIWSVTIGLILLTVFLILMVQRFKISQKQKKIIEKQKTEVEKQKKEVEEKNHEILDSINYAKRIQTAILPQPRVVKEFLKSSFVLYIPKDIVAGDFYWMENIDQTVYIAACDCTGHGVPGALVSVVCNNALNRALNEYGKRLPSEIFDKTRELVIENFAKSDEEVQDGMDASLAALDVKNRTLLWSGANNPLWIIKKDSGTNEYVFEDIKADKQPIGKGYETKPFTTHQVQLNEGDTIYLFTDGYADQFGGEKNKKMTKAKFRELILSLAHLPMEKQRTALLDFHDQYRGNEEQVDDICVIGVRV